MLISQHRQISSGPSLFNTTRTSLEIAIDASDLLFICLREDPKHQLSLAIDHRRKSTKWMSRVDFATLCFLTLFKLVQNNQNKPWNGNWCTGSSLWHIQRRSGASIVICNGPSSKVDKMKVLCRSRNIGRSHLEQTRSRRPERSLKCRKMHQVSSLVIQGWNRCISRHFERPYIESRQNDRHGECRVFRRDRAAERNMHKLLLHVGFNYTVMISYVFGILAVHASFWKIYMPFTSAPYPYYYLPLVPSTSFRQWYVPWYVGFLASILGGTLH
jgi:hypothetical protein